MAFVKHFTEQPKHRLRKAAGSLRISVASVRNALSPKVLVFTGIHISKCSMWLISLEKSHSLRRLSWKKQDTTFREAFAVFRWNSASNLWAYFLAHTLHYRGMSQNSPSITRVQILRKVGKALCKLRDKFCIYRLNMGFDRTLKLVRIDKRSKIQKLMCFLPQRNLKALAKPSARGSSSQHSQMK